MKIAVASVAFLLAGNLVAAGDAAAQLYRWTDENGRTHFTDSPPPKNAKGVQQRKPGAAPAAAPAAPAAEAAKGAEAPAGQLPFEVALAAKDFPVTLYTSPSCKAGCEQARALLNRRGVPFKEFQVWDEDTNAELKKVSGGNEVPVLVVGRSVHRGFEQGAYDSLLDSARYPKAGSVPARRQGPPPLPEGYQAPGSQKPAAAEPVKPEPEPAPLGPYAPRPPQAQKK